jgi:alginate O-acetyltransferase complex protein AlgI
MLFNSDVFLFGFLPIVFAVFWGLRSKQARYVWLSASSYVFYGWWDWRFCLLLLLSSLISFVAALRITAAPTRSEARRWMAGSVGVDLALLGFFKYYNFFAENIGAVAPGVAPPILHIVLPIGISFYTFHTISYIVDVADGRVRATRNLFEYLTYVSLFSQLVAGPIVRFRQIEQDLEHLDDAPRRDYVARGIGFFVVGLIKKVIVADRLARYVNPMLVAPASLSVSGAWLAALGYTFQLYYDFSGYSDMAVGLGYLFGLRIPQNFNAPYTALGIRDFWRRWHISLSTWLRDYVYIRLGGDRLGPVRLYVNLLLTMLIGGLWHGANWTFVIWGLYHGILLSLDRLLEPWLNRWPVIVRRAATFAAVVIGWVIFRSTSLAMAVVWLRRMAGLGSGAEPPPAGLLVWALACVAAVNTIPETQQLHLGRARRWAFAYAIGFFVAYVYMNGRQSVFLYYQF